MLKVIFGPKKKLVLINKSRSDQIVLNFEFIINKIGQRSPDGGSCGIDPKTKNTKRKTTFSPCCVFSESQEPPSACWDSTK